MAKELKKIKKKIEKGMAAKATEYYEKLMYDLDCNIKIVGGVGVYPTYLKDHKISGFENFVKGLYQNGVEFKIRNRRVIKDPLKMTISR